MKRCSTSEEEEQPIRKCSNKTTLLEELLEWDHLWKHAPVFPLGEKWTEPHVLSKHNWKFSKLQDAFKEGGVLHGKDNVYLVTVAETQGLTIDGQPRLTYSPVVIAIVSPFPPSDKMAIIPVQEGMRFAKVIDMERMNMAWLPCSILPLIKQQLGDTQISVLSYVQNMRATWDDIGIELGPNSHICLPYFDNLSKAKQSTAVDIVYPAEGEPIVVDRYDWKITFREPFIDGLINKGKLSIDHKDAFKVFLKEKVIQAHRANRKAILALEDLRRTDHDKVAAFENMRFYKFYPDFSVLQSLRINPYYGNAHQVF